MKNVHPKLVHALCEAIIDTPVDFTIVSGVRTTKEQQELFAKGRTAPGRIVTNADGIWAKSNHQQKTDGFGYAIDFYPYYAGAVQVNAPAEMFEKVARHVQAKGKALGYTIDWGGDWVSFVDRPHLELKL